MTPQHPLWTFFFDRLQGPEGCDLKAGHPSHSKCRHDFTHSRKILATMEDIDVERSIDYFRESGGVCDCQVLYAVGPPD